MRQIGICITCFFILLACSCSNKESIPIINLKKSIFNINSHELNNVIDSLKIIELKSDSCFIKDLSLFGEVENKLYGYSSEGDIFILTDQGTLLKHFNHTGRGPCEYLFIWGAKLDQYNRQIIIHDFRNKLLKYSLNGEFMEEISNDLVKNLSDIAPTNSGYYGGTLANSSKKSNNVVIFDNRYNVLNTFFPVSDISQINTSGMVNMESIVLSDSILIYKPTFSDTVYSITSQAATPILIINQENLCMPDKIRITAGKTADQEKSKYINNFYGKLAGNYYIASYQFNNETYYDLWDLHSQKSIIHQNINEDLRQKGVKEGFKIIVNNQQLYVWPRYVMNNILYCVLDYSYFHNSTTETDENKNPVVIKIWLNKNASGITD